MIFFSSNLRYLRERKGLTQGRLAEMIGVRPNTVSNYETGNSCPDFKILEMLVDILDADAQALLFTDMRGGDGGGPVRIASDVRAPYGGKKKGMAESGGIPAPLQEVLSDYDDRLEKMGREMELLREAMLKLSENKKP